MSPVDQAGSVSEISPRHSFLYKNFDVFRFFPYEHSSPDTGTVRDETFSAAYGL